MFEVGHVDRYSQCPHQAYLAYEGVLGRPLPKNEPMYQFIL